MSAMNDRSKMPSRPGVSVRLRRPVLWMTVGFLLVLALFVGAAKTDFAVAGSKSYSEPVRVAAGDQGSSADAAQSGSQKHIETTFSLPADGAEPMPGNTAVESLPAGGAEPMPGNAAVADVSPESVLSDALLSETDANEQWETITIRQMMQEDLRQALEEAKNKGASAGAQAVVSAAPVGGVLAPRLVALYGVGRSLMAEVQVGQKAYLYIKGQPYPAGYTGDSRVYQLRGMNGACVQLERREDRHSLCLRMLLSEARP